MSTSAPVIERQLFNFFALFCLNFKNLKKILRRRILAAAAAAADSESARHLRAWKISGGTVRAKKSYLDLSLSDVVVDA